MNLSYIFTNFILAYICAEWDFGGLPSWLLYDGEMVVRSTYSGFMKPLKKYYSVLLPILSEYQYNRRNGGSIIAFQIENEYGSYGDDKTYLEQLRSIYIKHGLDELFFTSDGPTYLEKGTLDNTWATVNFQSDISVHIDELIAFRSTNHIMISEYWTGWFDRWGGKHNTGNKRTYTADELQSDLEEVLLKSNYEISINFYMFSGGTNFGFTSGAHHLPDEDYSPLVTSYDYDAPISEAGDLTKKYFAIRNVIKKFYEKNPTLIVYNHERSTADAFIIAEVKSSKKVSFGKIKITDFKPFDQILADQQLATKHQTEEGALCMEDLKKDGQSQGFIVYTSNNLPDLSQTEQKDFLSITEIADNAIILINGEKVHQSSHTEYSIMIDIPSNTNSLTIIVENMGRINFGEGLDYSRKGILSQVLINNVELTKWTIHLLEFPKGTSSVTDWKPLVINEENKMTTLTQGPNLFRASFTIKDDQSIEDTFLLLDSNWNKGVAFINGFNLGRYWNVGPQKTLYISKHLLTKGLNHIHIFELYSYGQDIELVDKPILETRD